MLQTENSTNNSPINRALPQTDKQADIVKRLQELNKWQAEQKKLLEEKQTMQRQMLGMEQKTMYQMLGLQQSLQDRDNESYKDDEEEEYEEEDNTEVSMDTSQLEEEYTEQQERKDEPCSFKTLTSGYATEDYVEVTKQKPKKPFLKRGQGLKQRFKIDPEELRLNNLPRYKYANAHPRLRLKTPGKPQNDGNVKTKSVNFNAKSQSREAKTLPTTNLDAQEQRFQNLLISSKNTCSSTPDTKSSFASEKHTTITSNASTISPKVRFSEPKSEIIQKFKKLSTNESPPIATPTMAWSKILDSQQLTPLEVPRTRLQTLPQTEESIFELLEQQAKNGSFDMDSSCIKQFMKFRRTEELNDTEDNFPVKENIKTKRLEPLIQKNIEDASSMDEEMDNDKESQLSEEGSTTETEETTHKTIETTNSYGPTQLQQFRVRFSDSNETHEYEQDSDSLLNNSTRLSAGASSQIGQGDSTNIELFDQFKQALFAALKIKADKHLANDATLNSTSSNTTLTPDESLANLNYNSEYALYPSTELQEKTDLIKIRLSELEKEINNFKENNLVLMKAKQDHELEKALHAQEHVEAMERLKDEKIQMEIYLHDERIKLEDEKRLFEQQMKMKNQGMVAKQRKDNELLKEQIVKLEAELKTKDINHTSAQARLRTQIRTLEREQKQLHEQIEALRKDNKRLENENLKISREQNNKMLQEINRNIAKLAPKIQNPTIPIPEEGPPTLSVNRTLSKSIVAAATANKNYRPTTKKYVKSQPAKSCKKFPSPPTSADADTTPESSFAEEENRQKPQQQEQYILDNEDEDDEDDEDILKGFQKTPIRRNNKSNSPKSLSSKTQKQHENLQPVPPPPSPRTNNDSNANNMKREIINNDGSKDIWYPNGNLKKISPDGMLIRMLYYNKDIKETNINEGTVKYYYSETNTWHTSYLDGLEILEFPNGMVEHRHKNGIIEVHYPNNSVKVMDPKDEHKQEEWRYADGTHLVQLRNGDKILSLPNGQKEIHNKLHKRREYPDGTVKIVYPDGSTETRYSNGRVRLKDKDGKLVMDTDLAK